MTTADRGKVRRADDQRFGPRHWPVATVQQGNSRSLMCRCDFYDDGVPGAMYKHIKEARGEWWSRARFLKSERPGTWVSRSVPGHTLLYCPQPLRPWKYEVRCIDCATSWPDSGAGKEHVGAAHMQQVLARICAAGTEREQWVEQQNANRDPETRESLRRWRAKYGE